MNSPRRPQPPQNPPPVQRLRLRYCKRGRARFTSHRDFSRALERALRRAQIPMALSSGFNQHPRISYINASPTGAATEADYVELGLAEARDLDWVRDVLTAALPDGMAILEVVEASGAGLVERLTASRWEVDLGGAEPDAVRRAADRLWAAERVEVERRARDGVRTFDARGALLALTVEDGPVLDLVLRHDSPLVRPDDVVQALLRLDPGLIIDVPPLTTRTEQGRWDGVRIVGPFE